jgi:8-oxo-dGTP diphosphatase
MENTVHGIACAVINKKGKILLLKRSPDKKLFPNKWFVVGAYPLDENADFEKKVHIELVDETGMDGKIIKNGELLKIEVNGQIIDIHTFLAKRNSDVVKINDEHTEFKWVNIQEMKSLDLVPGTYEMIDSLIKK